MICTTNNLALRSFKNPKRHPIYKYPIRFYTYLLKVFKYSNRNYNYHIPTAALES